MIDSNTPAVFQRIDTFTEAFLLNTIQILEQIQKIDLEINAVEEEERAYRRDIEKAGAEIKGATEGVEALQSSINELGAVMRDAEEKIRQSAEKADRDEKRLNTIKNSKELNALTREINAANKAKKQGEQEKAALTEKLSEKKALLEAKEAALREINSRLERLTGELDDKCAGWKEALDGKLRARGSVAKGIRPDILKRYETIKAKRGGVGLVQVKDETCQGCYIHIPPQVYIQLKRGTDELISCPHCHRILYAASQGATEAV